MFEHQSALLEVLLLEHTESGGGLTRPESANAECALLTHQTVLRRLNIVPDNTHDTEKETAEKTRERNTQWGRGWEADKSESCLESSVGILGISVRVCVSVCTASGMCVVLGVAV